MLDYRMRRLNRRAYTIGNITPGQYQIWTKAPLWRGLHYYTYVIH